MVNDSAVAKVLETTQPLLGKMTEIAVGIVILLVGFSVGVLAKKLLKRLLQELELNALLRKVSLPYDGEKWLSVGASWLVYVFTVLIFLDHVGIRSYALYLFAGALLLLVLLTFFVGLKDVIPNLIGWLVIQKQGHIKVGRSITVKEIAGVVERISYLETEIRTERGDTLYVPNALFLKSKFRVRE